MALYTLLLLRLYDIYRDTKYAYNARRFAMLALFGNGTVLLCSTWMMVRKSVEYVEDDSGRHEVVCVVVYPLVPLVFLGMLDVTVSLTVTVLFVRVKSVVLVAVFH